MGWHLLIAGTQSDGRQPRRSRMVMVRGGRLYQRAAGSRALRVESEVGWLSFLAVMMMMMMSRPAWTSCSDLTHATTAKGAHVRVCIYRHGTRQMLR